MKKLNFKKVFLSLYCMLFIVSFVFYSINVIKLNSLRHDNVSIDSSYLHLNSKSIKNIAIKTSRSYNTSLVRTKKLKSYIDIGGLELPNITGKALYNVKTMNNRFEKQEFLMPVLYSVAKKICIAQRLALEEGNCLKIYESYRPYSTQMSIANSLRQLANSDEEVKNGIHSSGWSQSWFIAQNLSNHQRGIAIDTSLVKITNSKIKYYGDYYYIDVTNYDEYKMPTQMHELSKEAATYAYGVSNKNQETLQKTPLAKTMNTEAKLLQKYCIMAGLSPLASEWWHFEDLETKNNTKNNYSTGRYYITECYSE